MKLAWRSVEKLEPVINDYWMAELTDDGILWKFSLKEIREAYNLSPHSLSKAVADAETSPIFRDFNCLECGVCLVNHGVRSSRRELEQLFYDILRGQRCPPCREKEGERLAVKKAAEEAVKELEHQKRKEKRRKEIELQYGARFEGVECPECEMGFLVVKFNSKTMTPFWACSSFTTKRHDACDYTCPLAFERHREFLEMGEEQMRYNKNLLTKKHEVSNEAKDQTNTER